MTRDGNMIIIIVMQIKLKLVYIFQKIGIFKFPNERDSNKTVSIFILKTIYFILQNMFRSLHTSSSVVQIKSTVNI